MTEYLIRSTSHSVHQRKTKDGKTVYDVFFRVVDKATYCEKQKKLSGFRTKALAEAGYAEFVSRFCEVDRYAPKPIKKDPAKAEPLVNDLYAEYISRIAPTIKESAMYDKQKVFARFILPPFGNKKASELTEDALKKWQNDLMTCRSARSKNYLSASYVEKINSYMLAFGKWITENYRIPVTVPKIARTVKARSKVYKIWERSTFDKFIAVVDDQMYRALFTMMFFTGRRKGEIFALTRDDINTDKRSIIWSKSLTRKILRRSEGADNDRRYAITTTKENKEQKLPYADPVADVLTWYEGGRPFFFGGEEPLGEKTVTRRFEEYCRIADVPIIRIHDLRHSFVSMLIANGENFMVIAELIGDTVEQVVKTYGHLYQDALVRAVQKI